VIAPCDFYILAIARALGRSVKRTQVNPVFEKQPPKSSVKDSSKFIGRGEVNARTFPALFSNLLRVITAVTLVIGIFARSGTARAASTVN